VWSSDEQPHSNGVQSLNGGGRQSPRMFHVEHALPSECSIHSPRTVQKRFLHKNP